MFWWAYVPWYRVMHSRGFSRVLKSCSWMTYDCWYVQSGCPWLKHGDVRVSGKALRDWAWQKNVCRRHNRQEARLGSPRECSRKVMLTFKNSWLNSNLATGRGRLRTKTSGVPQLNILLENFNIRIWEVIEGCHIDEAYSSFIRMLSMQVVLFWSEKFSDHRANNQVFVIKMTADANLRKCISSWSLLNWYCVQNRLPNVCGRMIRYCTYKGQGAVSGKIITAQVFFSRALSVATGQCDSARI